MSTARRNALLLAALAGSVLAQDTSQGTAPVFGQGPAPATTIASQTSRSPGFQRNPPTLDLGTMAGLLASLYSDRSWNTVVIPGSPPEPTTPGPGSSTRVGTVTHTVVRGDTLWKIAQRYCGSGERWREVFQANQGKIRDPHWIYPGQTFVIPCGNVSRQPGGKPGGKPGGFTVGDAFGRNRPPGRQPTPPASGNILPAGQNVLTHLPMRPGTYRKGSRFGVPRGDHRHGGIDLPAARGTPVYAAGAGVVSRAEWSDSYGWVVYVDHPGGYQTRYAHLLQRPSVRAGQRIAGGTFLGPVNSTGNSTGHHLHFEVRRNGRAQNPEHYCRF